MRHKLLYSMKWRRGNDRIIAITIQACAVCIDHYNSFRHYPQFCRSRFLSKYQLEYISCGYLVMDDILLNNNALFYFMEVCVNVVIAGAYSNVYALLY